MLNTNYDNLRVDIHDGTGGNLSELEHRSIIDQSTVYIHIGHFQQQLCDFVSVFKDITNHHFHEDNKKMLDAITIHDIKFHIMYENKYVSPEYKLLNLNQQDNQFIKIKTAFGYDQVRNKEFNFCLQSYKNNQNEFQLQK